MPTAVSLLAATWLAAAPSGLDARQTAALQSIDENLPRIRQRIEEGTHPDMACAGLSVSLRRLEGSRESEAVRAHAEVNRLCKVEGPLKFAQKQLALEEAQPSTPGRAGDRCWDVNHVLDRLDPTDAELEKAAGPVMLRFNDLCSRKVVEGQLGALRKARAAKEDLQAPCAPVYFELKRLALDRRAPTRKVTEDVHKLCPEQSLADTVQVLLSLATSGTREQTPRGVAATCAFATDSFAVLSRKKHPKLPELKKLAGERCPSR